MNNHISRLYVIDNEMKRLTEILQRILNEREAILREEKISYGTQKDFGISIDQHQWIPCSERMPEEDGIYDVTCKSSDRFCRRLFFHTADRSWIRDWESRHENLAEFVIAWMPLPEPFKADA